MRREVLPLLRRLLRFDAGVMSTTDPATVLWTSCVLDGAEPSPDRHLRLFHNEYAEDDVHRVADLARTTAATGILSSLSDAVRAASPRAAFLGAMGVTDELRVALCLDGQCWGSLVAYRGSGTFSEDDAALARAVAPALAHGLRLAMLRHVASQPASDEAPAVLHVGPDGTVRPLHGSSSPAFEDLLDAAGQPSAVRALAASAEAGAQNPSAVVQGRSGRFVRVHVVPGAGAERLAIVEPARPVELAWTLAVAYGLTPRERTVVMGVARGLSAKEIALELTISPWTVQDHVKSALAKVGVDSGKALVAHLFHDHVLPRREAGLHPGPWGWFVEGTPQS